MMPTAREQDPGKWQAAMSAFARLLYASRDQLPVFTVYCPSDDYPTGYTARLSYALAGDYRDGSLIHMDTLAEIHDCMEHLGRAKLDRSPGDHPSIIEVWL
jgi:hypothetical protein